MNNWAVISRKVTAEKFAFYSKNPVFSILDPTVTFSLPKWQVACGIADTFVHVMEQYMTAPGQSRLMDRWAEGILLSLVEIAPEIVEKQDNYERMADFMLCATMGLNHFIGMGVREDWATHLIGHDLTALHGLTHGATLTIVMPGLWRTLKEKKMAKLVQYGERVWGITAGSDEQRADEAIARTEAFFRSLGLPTRLADANIGEETILEIERRFNERKPPCGEHTPGPATGARRMLQNSKKTQQPMYTIQELRDRIKAELDKQAYVEEPRSLFEPIKYIMEDGGKRLRPVLTLMAYNLYRDDIEKALTSAIGIEIFHNYTLLHDDVMDDAELRRGRQTVHKKWNSNVAILSGDAAAITAYKQIEEVDDIYLRRTLDGFNQVAMDVCKGQQYDMEFETRNDVTEEEYIHMIYLKTSVLIAGSIRHGALIAGAPEHEYNALYDFGGYLGLVFQLQDDYLDVYGDVAEFGKKIGGDILSNKKTYMLIKELELACPADKALLQEWLQKKTYDPAEKIRAVTEIYNRTGIREAVMTKIEDYMEKSREALAKVDVPEERKIRFREMMDYIGGRKK